MLLPFLSLLLLVEVDVVIGNVIGDREAFRLFLPGRLLFPRRRLLISSNHLDFRIILFCLDLGSQTGEGAGDMLINIVFRGLHLVKNLSGTLALNLTTGGRQ